MRLFIFLAAIQVKTSLSCVAWADSNTRFDQAVHSLDSCSDTEGVLTVEVRALVRTETVTIGAAVQRLLIIGTGGVGISSTSLVRIQIDSANVEIIGVRLTNLDIHLSRAATLKLSGVELDNVRITVFPYCSTDLSPFDYSREFYQSGLVLYDDTSLISNLLNSLLREDNVYFFNRGESDYIYRICTYKFPEPTTAPLPPVYDSYTRRDPNDPPIPRPPKSPTPYDPPLPGVSDFSTGWPQPPTPEPTSAEACDIALRSTGSKELLLAASKDMLRQREALILDPDDPKMLFGGPYGFRTTTDGCWSALLMSQYDRVKLYDSVITDNTFPFDNSSINTPFGNEAIRTSCRTAINFDGVTFKGSTISISPGNACKTTVDQCEVDLSVDLTDCSVIQSPSRILVRNTDCFSANSCFSRYSVKLGRVALSGTGSLIANTSSSNMCTEAQKVCNSTIDIIVSHSIVTAVNVITENMCFGSHECISTINGKLEFSPVAQFGVWSKGTCGISQNVVTNQCQSSLSIDASLNSPLQMTADSSGLCAHGSDDGVSAYCTIYSSFNFRGSQVILTTLMKGACALGGVSATSQRCRVANVLQVSNTLLEWQSNVEGICANAQTATSELCLFSTTLRSDNVQGVKNDVLGKGLCAYGGVASSKGCRVTIEGLHNLDQSGTEGSRAPLRGYYNLEGLCAYGVTSANSTDCTFVSAAEMAGQYTPISNTVQGDVRGLLHLELKGLCGLSGSTVKSTQCRVKLVFNLEGLSISNSQFNGLVNVNLEGMGGFGVEVDAVYPQLQFVYVASEVVLESCNSTAGASGMAGSLLTLNGQGLFGTGSSYVSTIYSSLAFFISSKDTLVKGQRYTGFSSSPLMINFNGGCGQSSGRVKSIQCFLRPWSGFQYPTPDQPPYVLAVQNTDIETAIVNGGTHGAVMYFTMKAFGGSAGTGGLLSNVLSYSVSGLPYIYTEFNSVTGVRGNTSTVRGSTFIFDWKNYCGESKGDTVINLCRHRFMTHMLSLTVESSFLQSPIIDWSAESFCGYAEGKLFLQSCDVGFDRMSVFYISVRNNRPEFQSHAINYNFNYLCGYGSSDAWIGFCDFGFVNIDVGHVTYASSNGGLMKQSQISLCGYSNGRLRVLDCGYQHLGSSSYIDVADEADPTKIFKVIITRTLGCVNVESVNVSGLSLVEQHWERMCGTGNPTTVLSCFGPERLKIFKLNVRSAVLNSASISRINSKALCGSGDTYLEYTQCVVRFSDSIESGTIDRTTLVNSNVMNVTLDGACGVSSSGSILGRLANAFTGCRIFFGGFTYNMTYSNIVLISSSTIVALTAQALCGEAYSGIAFYKCGTENPWATYGERLPSPITFAYRLPSSPSNAVSILYNDGAFVFSDVKIINVTSPGLEDITYVFTLNAMALGGMVHNGVIDITSRSTGFRFVLATVQVDNVSVRGFAAVDYKGACGMSVQGDLAIDKCATYLTPWFRDLRVNRLTARNGVCGVSFEQTGLCGIAIQGASTIYSTNCNSEIQTILDSIEVTNSVCNYGFASITANQLCGAGGTSVLSGCGARSLNYIMNSSFTNITAFYSMVHVDYVDTFLFGEVGGSYLSIEVGDTKFKEGAMSIFSLSSSGTCTGASSCVSSSYALLRNLSVNNIYPVNPITSTIAEVEAISLFEVRDCVFKNYSNTAVFVSNTNLTVKRSTFSFGKSLSGAAIYSDLSVLVDSSSFTSLLSSTDGGAISAVYCNVTNSNFVGNSATANGGALYCVGASVRNSTFDQSSALSGGAIYTVLSLDARNIIVNNSKYSFVGGSVYAKNCQLRDSAILRTRPYDTILLNSTVGGGMYCLDSADVTNSRFTLNNAEAGGDIWSPLIVISDSIMDFSSAIEGGSFNGKSVKSSNCTYSNCRASQGGCINALSIESLNDKFINGAAAKFAGCISVSSGQFTNTLFKNCSSAVLGGAVFGREENGSITINAEFQYCSSVEDGAAVVSNGYISLNSSNFTNCNGRSIVKVLGIRCSDFSAVKLLNNNASYLIDGPCINFISSTFVDNSGTSMLSTTVNILGSVMRNNTGCVHILGGSVQGSLNIANSTITRCTSECIRCERSNCQLRSTTFSYCGNSAISCRNGSLKATGIRVHNSNATLGGGMFIRTCEVAINDTILMNNHAINDKSDAFRGIEAFSDIEESDMKELIGTINTGLGGGIYVGGDSFLVMGNVTFANNTAEWGGALAVVGRSQVRVVEVHTDVAMVVIHNNSAEKFGGGFLLSKLATIGIESTLSSKFSSQIENSRSCRISGNSAKIAGSALFTIGENRVGNISEKCSLSNVGNQVSSSPSDVVFIARNNDSSLLRFSEKDQSFTIISGASFSISGVVIDSLGSIVTFQNSASVTAIVSVKFDRSDSLYVEDTPATLVIDGLFSIAHVGSLSGRTGASGNMTVQIVNADSAKQISRTVKWKIITCKPGQGRLDGIATEACVLCTEGKYSIGGDVPCRSCPVGSRGCNKKGVSVPQTTPGYWRTLPREQGIIGFIKCTNDHCAGGENICSDHRDNKSAICSRCLPGYELYHAGCSVCDTSKAATLLSVLVVFMFVLIYTITMYQTAFPDRSAAPFILSDYIQMGVFLTPEVDIGKYQTLQDIVGILNGTPSTRFFIYCTGPFNPAVEFHVPVLIFGGVMLFVVVTLAIQRWISNVSAWKNKVSIQVARMNSKYRGGWLIIRNFLVITLSFLVINCTFTLINFMDCQSAGWETVNGKTEYVSLVATQSSIVCESRNWNTQKYILATWVGVWWLLLICFVVHVAFDMLSQGQGARRFWPALFFSTRIPEIIPEVEKGKWLRTTTTAMVVRSLNIFVFKVKQWWVIVTVVRRATIIGIFYLGVKVYNQNTERTILSLSIITVSIWIFITCFIRPYKERSDNIVDILSLHLLLLVLSTRGFSDTEASRTFQFIILVAMYLLNLARTLVLVVRKIAFRVTSNSAYDDEKGFTSSESEVELPFDDLRQNYQLGFLKSVPSEVGFDDTNQNSHGREVQSVRKGKDVSRMFEDVENYEKSSMSIVERAREERTKKMESCFNLEEEGIHATESSGLIIVPVNSPTSGQRGRIGSECNSNSTDESEGAYLKQKFTK